MVPLLLYVPPILGQPLMDMKAVAGITVVQSLAASLAGIIGHGRRRIHTKLVAFMGGAVAIGSLIGGLTSYWVSGAALQILFAGLGLLAGVLLFIPVRDSEEEVSLLCTFNRPIAVALGLGIGLLGGLVGQGGGFMIVPGLIYLLRIPTRVALGSTLAIGLISGAAGFAGKALTAQIPLWPSIAVAAGALLGSLCGSRLSQRVSQVTLRRMLAVVVLASALRVGWDMAPLSIPVTDTKAKECVYTMSEERIRLTLTSSRAG